MKDGATSLRIQEVTFIFRFTATSHTGTCPRPFARGWGAGLCVAVLVALAALADATAGALEAFHQDTPLPWHTRWGRYDVSIDQLETRDQRFRITDSAGQVLREIRAPFIDEVSFPDLSGRGRSEELRVITHPEQNTLGDIRTYCFSLRPSLHRILAMRYGFQKVRDLDHDGRPELISDDPAPLEWTAGLCHACCPSVIVVLRWDGRHYVVANRRFPSVALRKAHVYRGEFLEALHRFQQAGEDEGPTLNDIMGPAIGYWANAATVGRQEDARRWIVARLLPAWREQFLGSLPEIQERLRHAHLADHP